MDQKTREYVNARTEDLLRQSIDGNACIDTEELSILLSKQNEDDKNKADAELRVKELKAKRCENIIGAVKDGLTILAPAAAYVGMSLAVLKFEETGCVSTKFGNGILNRLSPKK